MGLTRVFVAAIWAAQCALAANALLAAQSTSVHNASYQQVAQNEKVKNSLQYGNYDTFRITNINRDFCPASCSRTGANPTKWPAYHSTERIGLCKEPMLLNFAVTVPLNDPSLHVNIQACTADYALNSAASMAMNEPCTHSNTNRAKVSQTLQLSSSGRGSSASGHNAGDIITALEQLQAHLSQTQTGCHEVFQFATSGTSVIGLYVGSGLQGQGIVGPVLESFIDHVKNEGMVGQLAAQLCKGPSARYALGIMATRNADVPAVQKAVLSWKSNSCVTSFRETTDWKNVTLDLPVHRPVLSRNGTVARNATNNSNIALQSRDRIVEEETTKFLPRAGSSDSCRTIQVASGDTCESLASECGIFPAQFTQYNPNSTLCSTLTPDEHVCCSSGQLPDFKPKPQDNGYCFERLVQTGDSCDQIAANYSITVDDINKYNRNTWGWMGCNDLLAGYLICLSEGYPPMPLPISNAVCGPQVNGTAKAPPGSDLSTLNECALNACCDIWGQCGTTAEFCTRSNSSTAAPGTAAKGENGCISNCGTDIITGSRPSSQFSVAYFEGNDWSRPCLNMPLTALNTSAYTHVHYAFATLTPDFSLNISSVQAQMPFFVALTAVKKIISIGGWEFSTSPDTYMIFRDAVKPVNRQTLIKNVLDFLDENNLDGVDFDWEYPGESDIPGIPASTSEDSVNFFYFLNDLSTAMKAKTSGKSISITAPASFWYLKNIPITAISLVVDYIVFMTYDLHGQWDYGRNYSDVGCPAGDCLMSPVNLTETVNTLSMITKAGVPAEKVVVGVTSYGRSFEMTTAGCWRSNCTYTGPRSGALPGPCTNTAGYLGNGEIDMIISNNPTAQQLFDDSSYTNVLVYNETQWVGYMNDTNKAERAALYKSLNFLGTVDWAVDLNAYDGIGESTPSPTSTSSCLGYIDPTVWAEETPKVTGIPGCTLVWPPLPLSLSTTITFPPWITQITATTWTTVTTTFHDGLITSFPSQIPILYPTSINIPPVVTNNVPVWAVTLPTNTSIGGIALTSSVQPPPFPVTITPVMGGDTSISGATTTATQNATTFIYGTYTYYSPTMTETLGGITSVESGTTLPPFITTITPHPYPTVTQSTTDPKLNSRSTSWTSGKSIAPSAPPDTPGRGTTCQLFCDPKCPVCPPGFGSSGNGGDGSSTSTDSTTSTTSSSSSSTESPTETAAGGALVTECAFPLTYEPISALLAQGSSISSAWYSEFPTVTSLTTTTTSISSTSTQTTTAPAITSAVEGYAVLDNMPWGGFYDYYGAIDYTLPNPPSWGCDQVATNTMTMPGDSGLYSYPSSWAFMSAIHGYTSCTYTNPSAPSAATGTLTCPDLPSPVDCPNMTPLSTGSCLNSGDELISYVGQFYCLLDV